MNRRTFLRNIGAAGAASIASGRVLGKHGDVVRCRIWQTWPCLIEAVFRADGGDLLDKATKPSRIAKAVLEREASRIIDADVIVEIAGVFGAINPLRETVDPSIDGNVAEHFIEQAASGSVDYTPHCNVVLSAAQTMGETDSNVVGVGSPFGLVVSGMGGLLADVNPSDIGTVGASQTHYALEVLLHEIGHCFGLIHNFEDNIYHGDTDVAEDGTHVSTPLNAGYHAYGMVEGTSNACGESIPSTNATRDEPLETIAWDATYSDCATEHGFVHRNRQTIIDADVATDMCHLPQIPH